MIICVIKNVNPVSVVRVTMAVMATNATTKRGITSSILNFTPNKITCEK